MGADGTRTVEVALFRLRDGASEAAFLAASDALQAALAGCAGYLGRRLLRGEGGQWIDQVEWASREAALAAAATIVDLPGAATFMGFLDPASVRLLHLTPARVYEQRPGKDWREEGAR